MAKRSKQGRIRDKRKQRIRAAFRKAVFDRDNRTCQVCGAQYREFELDPSHQQVNAHHITDRNHMPNGGYVVENGITVCDTHGRFRRAFPEDNLSCHQWVEMWQSSGHTEIREGLHPDDLYKLIGSSFESAMTASLAAGPETEAKSPLPNGHPAPTRVISVITAHLTYDERTEVLTPRTADGNGHDRIEWSPTALLLTQPDVMTVRSEPVRLDFPIEGVANVAIVVLRYGDGDTFGTTEGHWRIAGAYPEYEQAAKRQARLYRDRPDFGHFGYFESVEIHVVPLMR